MSYILPTASTTVTASQRLVIRVVVHIAQFVSEWQPTRVQRLLRIISRGAKPGSYEDVSRARDDVLSVSTISRGPSACLVRSISVVLLCRLRGSWADWCVGVLAEPPFMAHAWVEADGRIVDEELRPDEVRVLVRVTAYRAASLSDPSSSNSGRR